MVQGSIGPSELPDLLLSLRSASSTGCLRLSRDGVARDLFFRAGVLVGAESSAETDALERLLVAGGVISEERHARVRSLIEAGERRGRALVESGCLTAASLCEWTERRVRFLAGDALAWDRASCEFEDGQAPPPGAIAVQIEPLDLVLEALRGQVSGRLAEILPPPDQVPETAAAAAVSAAGRLQPVERYVLSLVDGRRPVSEICFLSEVGETEALRVLALLARCGLLRGTAPGLAAAAGAPGGSAARIAPEAFATMDLPPGDSTAELRAIIRLYNEQFGIVYSYMIKEVGPIAEQILEKHLRESREAHAAVLGRCAVGRDGVLPDEPLVRSVNAMKSGNRRDALVSALGARLEGLMTAVRRILGPGHAEALARRMKEPREVRCARA